MTPDKLTDRCTKRVLAQSWLQVPAACCPIGGGLVKIGHGSDLSALVIGIAPYAICALLCCLFGIGYLLATFRYVCTGRPQQEFIEISTNAVVSIITLTPTTSSGRVSRAAPIPPGSEPETTLLVTRWNEGGPPTP